MSGYNNAFDFNAELAPTMDQPGSWNDALQGSSGLMEGGTAAQLHAHLDFTPSEGARSNGLWNCATCLSAFQTAFALDNHAKEATHQAYKCKCGTDFNKHSALKRHIDTKDAPKTFACTLCCDKFTRKDKLKDHCRYYHKVTEEGLLFLFESQGLKPRAVAPSRRRRAPVPLAAASSGPAPTRALAPPALASAESSLWSPSAHTGQQYSNFLAGPFVPAGPVTTTSPFIPASSLDSAAEFLTAAVAPSEDISGLAGDFFWDDTWAMGFDMSGL